MTVCAKSPAGLRNLSRDIERDLISLRRIALKTYRNYSLFDTCFVQESWPTFLP